MRRRDFVRIVAAGGVCAGGGHVGGAGGGEGPKEAKLKLSGQSNLLDSRDIKERFLEMEKLGLQGVDIGTIDVHRDAKLLGDALAGTNLKLVTAYAGRDAWGLLDAEEGARKEAVRAVKKYLTAASDFGAVGVTVIPATQKTLGFDYVTARRVLIETLHDLGEHAARAGTKVLLSPVDRNTCWFVRHLAEAAAICREANSSGVGIVGSFSVSAFEEPNEMGAFISARKYLHHVELAGWHDGLPGGDDRDFIDGFKGLKTIGYQGYCSLITGRKSEAEVKRSLAFIQEQWGKA